MSETKVHLISALRTRFVPVVTTAWCFELPLGAQTCVHSKLGPGTEAGILSALFSLVFRLRGNY